MSKQIQYYIIEVLYSTLSCFFYDTWTLTLRLAIKKNHSLHCANDKPTLRFNRLLIYFSYFLGLFFHIMNHYKNSISFTAKVFYFIFIFSEFWTWYYCSRQPQNSIKKGRKNYILCIPCGYWRRQHTKINWSFKQWNLKIIITPGHC